MPLMSLFRTTMSESSAQQTETHKPVSLLSVSKVTKDVLDSYLDSLKAEFAKQTDIAKLTISSLEKQYIQEAGEQINHDGLVRNNATESIRRETLQYIQEKAHKQKLAHTSKLMETENLFNSSIVSAQTGLQCKIAAKKAANIESGLDIYLATDIGDLQFPSDCRFNGPDRSFTLSLTGNFSQFGVKTSDGRRFGDMYRFDMLDGSTLKAKPKAIVVIPAH